MEEYFQNYPKLVDKSQKKHAEVALKWLKSSKIATKPIKMVAEIQLVYGPYVTECKIKAEAYRSILDVRIYLFAVT